MATWSFRFLSLLLMMLSLGCWRDDASKSAAIEEVPSPSVLPKQTIIQGAEFRTDEVGVPSISIEGKWYGHPAFTALYALGYLGREQYFDDRKIEPDEQKFKSCLDWLVQNLEKDKSVFVWKYHFDHTYNDISIKAPWISGFAQAVGIQALLEGYKKYGERRFLDTAIKASKAFGVSQKKGGVLFVSERGDWFEETPVGNMSEPSHILNGHLRAVIALWELYGVTKDKATKTLADRGTKALKGWMPLFDAGYWLKYDLNPRKTEILLQLSEPYGSMWEPLHVKSVEVLDPLSKKSLVLDAADDKAFSAGKMFLSGTDWAGLSEEANVRFRSTARIAPEPDISGKSKSLSPHLYMYVSLPAEWVNNLRKEPFVVRLEVLSKARRHIRVSIRNIAPDNTFRQLRMGVVPIAGQVGVQKVAVQIFPQDLGYPVGMIYGEKHQQYLAALCEHSKNNAACYWASVSAGYLRKYESKNDFMSRLAPRSAVVEQTVLTRMLSLDRDGVLRQHLAEKDTVFNDGVYDFNSPVGEPVYHPFLIALQALLDRDGMLRLGAKSSDIARIPAQFRQKFEWLDERSAKKASAARAIRWLSDQESKVGEASVWGYPFKNVYNDVISEVGWVSSFSQAYIASALEKHGQNALLRRALAAFGVDVADGGLLHRSIKGGYWFEEVPNRTHILNAHIASINSLQDKKKYLNQKLKNVLDRAVATLIEEFDSFDDGYWFKYDLNPKKDIWFNVEVVDGKTSASLKDICILNPRDASASCVNMEQTDENARNRIGGVDWENLRNVDGQPIRRVGDGRSVRLEAVAGGARQNSFFWLGLPAVSTSDYFDLPPMYLRVRYFDDVRSAFRISVRDIRHGSVMTFNPLRDGMIISEKTGGERTAYIPILPSDVGWYVGYEYLEFVMNELIKLEKTTSDPSIQEMVRRAQLYKTWFDVDRKAVGG